MTYPVLPTIGISIGYTFTKILIDEIVIKKFYIFFTPS